jgi:hypothetical protein
MRFRIHGVTTGRVRPQRWTRQPGAPRLFVAALGVAILATALGGGGGAPAFVATVNGVDVRGRTALVLVDTSGSMDGTELRVRAQLEALSAAGVDTSLSDTVNGSAITRDATWDLMPTIASQLARHSTIDTIYLVSDYQDFRANQPDAVDEFVATARSRRLRVYWATVSETPQAAYQEIAAATGGGIIPAR